MRGPADSIPLHGPSHSSHIQSGTHPPGQQGGGAEEAFQWHDQGHKWISQRVPPRYPAISTIHGGSAHSEGTVLIRLPFSGVFRCVQVTRDFGDLGLNSGKIQKWAPAGHDPVNEPPLWWVFYDDGDDEHLEAHEVEAGFVLHLRQRGGHGRPNPNGRLMPAAGPGHWSRRPGVPQYLGRRPPARYDAHYGDIGYRGRGKKVRGGGSWR